MKYRAFVAILAIMLLSTAAPAEEGMWQLDKFDAELFARMQELGLELSQEEIFAPGGEGIAYAIVNLGGGTGSFVSDYGLILTNHHVAFGALQRASSEENNYIRDGFYADRSETEIQAHGYEARVLVSIEDVSDRVLKKAKGKKGAKRYEAIEDAIKKITAEAEEGADVRVTIASFFGGMQYKMFTYFTIKDVREGPAEYLWCVGDNAAFDPRAADVSRTVARMGAEILAAGAASGAPLDPVYLRPSDAERGRTAR